MKLYKYSGKKDEVLCFHCHGATGHQSYYYGGHWIEFAPPNKSKRSFGGNLMTEGWEKGWKRTDASYEELKKADAILVEDGKIHPLQLVDHYEISWHDGCINCGYKDDPDECSECISSGTYHRETVELYQLSDGRYVYSGSSQEQDFGDPPRGSGTWEPKYTEKTSAKDILKEMVPAGVIEKTEKDLYD